MSQRDEVKAEVARLLEYDEQYTHDSDGTKWFDYESGADRILDDFDRIAGLLGYIEKVDAEYRTLDDGSAGVTVKPDGTSEFHSKPPTRQHRWVGPWEVA